MSTPEINDALERMNEQIAEAERALREIKLGVVASVDNAHAGFEPFTLSWAKTDKEWELVVIRNGGRLIQPLRATTREIRIRASTMLEQLVEQLHEEAGLVLKEVEKALARYGDFATKVRATAAKR
jgi:hypothetical protein